MGFVVEHQKRTFSRILTYDSRGELSYCKASHMSREPSIDPRHLLDYSSLYTSIFSPQSFLTHQPAFAE